MKLYHYTIGTKLPLILNDGFLYLTPRHPKHPEKPVVWFSSNAEYENTALKVGIDPITGQASVMTLSQLHEGGQGIYRFVFDDVDAYQWDILKGQARIPSKIRKRLIRRATEIKANPSEWYGVLHEVSVSAARLELLTNNGWQTATPEQLETIDNTSTLMGRMDDFGLVISKGKFKAGGKI